MNDNDDLDSTTPRPVLESAGERTTGGSAPIPVLVEPVRPRRAPASGPLRWVVALVATALVLAGAVGLTAVAGAGNGASPTLAYVPADALVYAEARFDLPGNQRDQATRFLARLPGLLDSANLSLKIDRALSGRRPASCWRMG